MPCCTGSLESRAPLLDADQAVRIPYPRYRRQPNALLVHRCTRAATRVRWSPTMDLVSLTLIATLFVLSAAYVGACSRLSGART